MSPLSPIAIGIDIGTQGVRALAADATGMVAAQAAEPLQSSVGVDGRFEQEPGAWWQAAMRCLRRIVAETRNTPLAGLAVTATSGTVCLLDADGRALRPALMYADRRATAEATELNEHYAEQIRRRGYRFDASFGLPKLMWAHRNEPELFAATRFCTHAADVLTGRLTSEYGVSDWSHALKTGYDLLDLRWPDFIDADIKRRLPQIVAPGTIIGHVTQRAAAETGLPFGAPVIAGMTDGCAAQIGAGVSQPGRWLSVLGTTLVFKGVTREPLDDPLGRIYAHRHPSGAWLPGASSSTGGEALANRFAGADLRALDAHASALTPSGIICYPLERTGERFPFAEPRARGFLLGEPTTPVQHFTAILEGVAYLERMAYEAITALHAPIEKAIVAAGGGARSRVWRQIRADVLRRPLALPNQTEAAFGAAVLAASATLFPSLDAATAAMTGVREIIEPRADAARYEEFYERFVDACAERGYRFKETKDEGRKTKV